MEQKVKTIISDILEHLGVQIENIDIHESEINPIFAIETNESAKLIGNRGETLQALSHIVKRTVEHTYPHEEYRFSIDVNGYQQKRIDELKQKAKMLAERARTFRHDVELPPMNAYERMVIHSVISEDEELSTLSEGEGKYRRVVIKYAPKEI